MSRLVVLLWHRHLQILVEEGAGIVRRLVGDPWDDDGFLPLVVASVGRERYIGTHALLAAHACRRMVVDDFSQPSGSLAGGVDRLAAFLLLLARIVERRLPHETLEWRFLVAGGRAVAADLPAACRLAGLEGATIARMPAAPPLDAQGLPGQAASLRVIGFVDDGQARAALMGFASSADASDGSASSLPAAILDTVCSEVASAPAGTVGHRDALLHDAWWRQAGPGGAVVPRAMPWNGRWRLEPVECDRLIDAERTTSSVLARLMTSLGVGADNTIVSDIAEWGDRPMPGSRAVSHLPHAARVLRLEELPRLFDRDRPTLPHSIVFALETQTGRSNDDKIVAPEGADLPFSSDHVVAVGRTSQRRLSFEIQAIDATTGHAHRLAPGSLVLPSELRARTALHLTVTCHACGVIELRFEIPSWRFRDTVLLDPSGRTHPDAERRASQIQRTCP